MAPASAREAPVRRVVPGIVQIALADLWLAFGLQWLYGHLHERTRSPLTRLQRERLATVVNGLLGGAPDSASIRRPCAA